MEPGDASMTELLPLKALDNRLSHDAHEDEQLASEGRHEKDTETTENSSKIQRWCVHRTYWTRLATCAVALLSSTIPLILLLAYATRLSHSLALNGCLPDGTFALPFTSTVWDAAQFFSITIPFTGQFLPGECFQSIGSGTNNGTPAYYYDMPCAGFTFAQVKTLDIAWDIIIGRGGQAALVAIAYRLFSHTFTKLMGEGEVGYDAFAATKLQCGSFGSLQTLSKHALGRVPLPVTSRAKWLYLAMAVSTAYILAFPTLISATTGYTAVFDPSVLISGSQADGSTNRDLHDCGGKLKPAWGVVQNRFVDDGTPGAQPIAYPGMPIDFDDSDLSYGYDWKDCA